MLLFLKASQSPSDHTLFNKKSDNSFLALLVYVDDIIVASNDNQAVSNLNIIFKMKDLSQLKYFLGLEVARLAQGISMCQCKHALEILSETGFLRCKPASIPMDPNLKLTQNDGDLVDDQSIYRRLIRKLLYLTITLLDLTYVSNRLIQFLASPRIPHL